MEDCLIPQEGFRSFNDFFTRKRKTDFSHLPDDSLICPCDGLLSRFPITKNASFRIKNTRYRLDELLGDTHLAQQFENGIICIFRLTPEDYHRYCYATAGRIAGTKRINGVLHCIRPVAQTAVPVYVQNSRTYQVVETRDYGLMIQMEIGALLVGRIRNIPKKTGQVVATGQEKGFFSFGGSTIVLLFQEEVSLLMPEVFKTTDCSRETRVRKGDPLLIYDTGR